MAGQAARFGRRRKGNQEGDPLRLAFPNATLHANVVDMFDKLLVWYLLQRPSGVYSMLAQSLGC